MKRFYNINDYEITTDGLIINKHNGHILKPQPNNKGYLRVSIGKKLCFVHKLVAEKYIPNPDNLPQVNHIDGNKNNNSVNNLEWVSNIENSKHAVINDLVIFGEDCSWSKLTEESVKFIRSHSEYSKIELSKMFNVSVSTINDVILYRTWKRVC